MRRLLVTVIATAGHVDHGKSTLVLALTGMDPDRFAEEKARGLTIDLGFAWTTLPSGSEVAFVDVPGHVRFIKNMLAGVGAIDACLFVVAATEGWKPQSEEHLRILGLLGAARGLIALTKVGLVDDDDRELMTMDVRERVADTFLADAPIVAVDAPAGIGLDELRGALDQLVAETPDAADRDRPRLWIDRVFAATGSGTVVTGTLTGGSLVLGDELVAGAAQLPVRIRAMQSHKSNVTRAAPGRRLAVNLTGVSHHQLTRGDPLVRPGQWHATQMVDATLRVLNGLGHAVSRRGAHQAYIGSGEHAVKVRVLGPDAIEPGATGAVRLHLPVALPLVPGDRYVLRESGRGETVGGGEILDVAPVLSAARAQPDRSVERVVAEREWIDVDELERLTGERRSPLIGRWVVDASALEAMTERLTNAVANAGALGLDVASLDERERAVASAVDAIVVDGGRVRNAKSDRVGRLADHPFVVVLEARPFDPPSPDDEGVDRAELRELVQRGAVVERDGLYFALAAIEQAARTVAGLLAAKPDGLTVAEIRDALGTSRKFLLPLLAHLDATGVTRRRGNVRIAGPRLPPA